MATEFLKIYINKIEVLHRFIWSHITFFPNTTRTLFLTRK